MDLKLKDGQILNAILLLTLQNNIAIKALSAACTEFIEETKGDDMAKKFEDNFNAFSGEFQL